MPTTRLSIAPLLLLLLAAGFWIHQIHVERPMREGGFGQADLPRYFFPMSIHLHEELRSGRLPHWNPHQLAGTPFLAAPAASTLYPLHAGLLAALAPARAHEVHAVLHLALVGIFTWLFARRIGLDPAASWTAAVTLMLSGEIVRLAYNTAYLSTFVWIPATLLCVDALVKTGAPRWALALGAVLALGFLGGDYQGLWYGIQAAVAYGIVALAAVAPAAARLRIVALATGAGFLALALAAPQLLPTAEMVREGARDFGGLDLAAAGAYAPTFQRALGKLPVLVPIVGLLGALDRRRRWLWLFFLVLASVSFLFALGTATPVFPLFHALPLGDVFRFPHRMLRISTLAVCVLGGVGIAALRAWIGGRGGRASALAGGVAWALAGLLTVSSYRNADLPLGVPALWTEGRYAPPELVEFLRERAGYDRTYVVDSRLGRGCCLDTKLGTVHRLSVAPDYEPLAPARYAEYFARGALWHGELVFQGRGADADRDLLRLLDMMSVRYYARVGGTRHPLPALLGRPGQAVGPVGIHERAEAVPRAYAVNRVSIEPDARNARARLLAPDFAPLHEAIVDRGRALDGTSSETLRAEITRYDADAVALTAECSAPCLAVLTDLHYPGWTARVDGRPVEIAAVNTLFRGVYLEPGRHRIDYRYEAREFRRGVAIAAAALSFVAAAWAIPRIARR